MKNKDAIEKAIEVLQRYVDGKETSLTKIAAHDAIKGLRQAQEKPASLDVSAINEALGALNEFKKSEDWQEGTFLPEYRNGNWHDDLNNYITPNIMATIRKALEAQENHIVDVNEKVDANAIEALVNADGCFQAALAEGIKDKMEDLPDCEEVYAFLDVYTRRIMQAHLHIIEALQSLTQAQEKPCVDDVNPMALMLKFSDAFDDENYPFKGEAYDLNLIEFAFKWLKEQGHLTSSEKPTCSIPEGFALVPVQPKTEQVDDALQICELEAKTVLKLIAENGFERTLVRFYKAMIKAVH